MRTAKEISEYFAQLPQNENVWCIWVTKSEIADLINETEYEDKNGNLIKLEAKDISNEMYKEIMSSVDNAEYVWDRFEEDLSETVSNVFSEYLNEVEEDEEDTELWDKK